MKTGQVIGIMGGSFNPVHSGHLMVASYIRQLAGLDEVWLSLSPANPLKTDAHPVSDEHRLAMLNLALADAPGLKPLDIELSLPRPSYTLRLLDTLSQLHPDKQFKLIIGSDNWLLFDRWRDPETILQQYGVIVYPRPGYDIDSPMKPGATLIDAPCIEISSTFVRQSIEKGLDMNFFLPHSVYKYIQQHNLYK